MKGVGLGIGVLVAGTALAAQDSDNLWLRPSALPDLQLFSGAMMISIPPYPGSAQARSLPFPILNGEWREQISFGASRFGVGGALGYTLFRSGGFSTSLGAEAVEPRFERMADALAGMGDRPATLFASAGIAWRRGPLELSLGLREGFRAEVGGGTVARATFTVPLGRRWLLEARVAGSAYDRRQVAYEYGISPEQAARRRALIQAGDPRLDPNQVGSFTPQAGWALLQSSLAVGFALSDHWRLGLTVLQQEVQGDARHSPLVQRPRSQGAVFGISHQL
jgi:outer membrane scaffolding protein for murein synthesis (MipA/OmpV family)